MTPFCSEALQQAVRQDRREPTGRARRNRPTAVPSAGCAQVNTAWNITNSTASRISRPATGCSTTASIRLVKVSGLAGGVTAAAMIRSASRCSARSSRGRKRPARCWRVIADGRCRRTSSRCRSRSAVPPLRTATAVVTGMPSSDDSRSRSIAMPRCRARSIMLSTSSIGRPTRFSSSTSRNAEAQVGGVGDADDAVRARLLARSAEHDVAGDLLVRAAAAQRIGARQVDDGDAAPGRRRRTRLTCARR